MGAIVMTEGRTIGGKRHAVRDFLWPTVAPMAMWIAFAIASARYGDAMGNIGM